MDGKKPNVRRAFSLVELLVVVGVIGVLVALLLPALSRARAQARSVRCMSNLHQIVLGLVEYNTEHEGWIVPSFNLPLPPGQSGGANDTAGPTQPMDGWPAILDREGFVSGNSRNVTGAFYCPDTEDLDGMAKGQTGTYLANPRGWTEWPMIFTANGGDSEPQQAVTIPSLGFDKIIRSSYWINAYNPIGSPVANIPANDLYYTTCVGFGPDNNGHYTNLHNTSSIRYASRTIAVADGLYMGRQSVDDLGQANSRIGYRHPSAKGPNTMANAGFADGHVEAIEGSQFPDALSGGLGDANYYTKKAINLGGPTVYANPDAVFTK